LILYQIQNIVLTKIYIADDERLGVEE